MGWGQGIGIGWPNASASAGPPIVMGYFEIASLCNGTVAPGTTSQLVDTSLYATGDYVAYNNELGYLAGLQLGNIVSTPSDEFLTISGPVYTGCPVNFAIDLVCPDYIPENMATVLIAPGLYNTGDYVFSPATNQTVLLGNIISNLESYQLIPISGQAYQACQVSYNVYDCIQEEYYTTGYYNIDSLGLGNRVNTQSGNYGWVADTTEGPQEHDAPTSPFQIGYVDYRCNDCNVTFSFELGGGEEENAFNIILFATESLGEVNFESSTNTLFVTVQYEIEFEEEETGTPLYRKGSVQFQIDKYIVGSGSENTYLGEEYAFTLPGGAWDTVGTNIYVTDMNVGNIALGPYFTGWDEDNKYITTYGNAWTFYYPT